MEKRGKIEDKKKIEAPSRRANLHLIGLLEKEIKETKGENNIKEIIFPITYGPEFLGAKCLPKHSKQ